MKPDRRPRGRCRLPECRASIVIRASRLDLGEDTLCEACYMGTSLASARLGLVPDRMAILACLARRYVRVAEVKHGLWFTGSAYADEVGRVYAQIKARFDAAASPD